MSLLLVSGRSSYEILQKAIRELRAEWDPKLREAMDEIVGRGR